VRSHGELFRWGIPTRRLEELDEKIRQKRKDRWPQNLSEESESGQPEEIGPLKPDDGFRSQFRVGGGNPPPSPIEILDWGLQHIERSREASLEARQESAMRLQLWSIIVLNVLNVLVNLLVALLK
jgi:hypothetical protein